MSLISILILVILVIVALLLIAVILVQDDQGEGIGGMFGLGGSTQMGSRSGNVLTRFTTILAAIFLLGAFALAWLNRTPTTPDILEKARAERLKQASQDNAWWVQKLEQQPAQTPTSQAPDQGGGQPAQPGTANSGGDGSPAAATGGTEAGASNAGDGGAQSSLRR